MEIDPRTAPLEALTRAVAEALQPSRDGSLWRECPCGTIWVRGEPYVEWCAECGHGIYIPSWDEEVGRNPKAHSTDCEFDCHGTGRVPVADLDALLAAAGICDSLYQVSVCATHNAGFDVLISGVERDYAARSGDSPLAATVTALAQAMGLDT